MCDFLSVDNVGDELASTQKIAKLLIMNRSDHCYDGGRP